MWKDLIRRRKKWIDHIRRNNGCLVTLIQGKTNEEWADEDRGNNSIIDTRYVKARNYSEMKTVG